MAMQLEICANSATSCQQAELGGATRVELCAGIPEGGTTPSAGEMAVARSLITIPIHVIIRPHAEDFSVDADTGAVADKTTGECFSAQPFPPFIQEIINEGGLVNRAKRQVAERRQDKR